MTLKEAIEVLKDAKYIGSDEYASDYDRRMKEAIDTVLSHINTGNKRGLDDILREKSIEQPDNQGCISHKKDEELMKILYDLRDKNIAVSDAYSRIKELEETK